MLGSTLLREGTPSYLPEGNSSFINLRKKSTSHKLKKNPIVGMIIWVTNVITNIMGTSGDNRLVHMISPDTITRNGALIWLPVFTNKSSTKIMGN